MFLEIVCITLAALQNAQAPSDTAPPVAWDTIGQRMKWEADHGFSGVVLMARDGKIAFNQAYGMANREKQIPMRTDSILAIGSTPIDFTKAGILPWPIEKLKLDDPITKYFEQVPDDKSNHHQAPDDRRSGLLISTICPPIATRPQPDRRLAASHHESEVTVRAKPDTPFAFRGLRVASPKSSAAVSYPEFVREHLSSPRAPIDTGFSVNPMPQTGGRRLRPRDGQINAPPIGERHPAGDGQRRPGFDGSRHVRWLQAVHGGKLRCQSRKEYREGTGLAGRRYVWLRDPLHRQSAVVHDHHVQCGKPAPTASMQFGPGPLSLVLNRPAPASARAALVDKEDSSSSGSSRRRAGERDGCERHPARVSGKAARQ